MPADINDHPFSPQSVAAESGAPSPRERSWAGFVVECERLLGHDLDGNDAASVGCGYSLDEAYDVFLSGKSPYHYVAMVRGRDRYSPNIGLDNAVGHPAAREFFYVTAIDGPTVYPLAGPYGSHAEAASKVDEARKIAMDPERNASFGRAAFMSYGVTKVTARAPRRSSLGRI